MTLQKEKQRQLELSDLIHSKVTVVDVRADKEVDRISPRDGVVLAVYRYDMLGWIGTTPSGEYPPVHHGVVFYESPAEMTFYPEVAVTVKAGSPPLAVLESYNPTTEHSPRIHRINKDDGLVYAVWNELSDYLLKYEILPPSR